MTSCSERAGKPSRWSSRPLVVSYGGLWLTYFKGDAVTNEKGNLLVQVANISLQGEVLLARVCDSSFEFIQTLLFCKRGVESQTNAN